MYLPGLSAALRRRYQAAAMPSKHIGLYLAQP
jgi:hypothetical protein